MLNNGRKGRNLSVQKNIRTTLKGTTGRATDLSEERLQSSLDTEPDIVNNNASIYSTVVGKSRSRNFTTNDKEKSTDDRRNIYRQSRTIKNNKSRGESSTGLRRRGHGSGDKSRTITAIRRSQAERQAEDQGRKQSILNRYDRRSSESFPKASSGEQLLTVQESARTDGNVGFISENDRPDLIDTRSWSWEKYALTYFRHPETHLPIRLLPHQIEDLEAMNRIARLVLNDPRRYGKSFIVCLIFVVRKLCETALGTLGKILYVSAVAALVDDFCEAIVEEMENNPRLEKNYGYLMKTNKTEKSRSGRKMSTNTRTIITLVTQPGKSFIGMNARSNYRGKGFRWIIFDDPVDLFHESEIPTMTRKLNTNISAKISPMAKMATIIIVGTRYDFKDLYVLLGEKPVWHIIIRKTIIQWGEFSIPTNLDREIIPTDILVPKPDEWEILGIELWENNPTCPDASPIQNVLFMFYDMGDRLFSQEMQNDPKPLNPKLNWEQFKPYKITYDKQTDGYLLNGQPPSVFRWVGHYDDATGESEDADDRAIVLVAGLRNEYYLVDHKYFRDISIDKYKLIEEFIESNEDKYNIRILLYVEVVKAQREAYQYLQHYTSLNVQDLNPKDRGAKEYRIMNNFAVELKQDKIWLNQDIRQKNKLEQEINGFPHIHVNGVDSYDQAIYKLRRPKILPYSK